MTPPPLPDPGPLVEIPAGSIDLRDEGSQRSWTVEVAAFRLASVPVTRALDRTPVTDVSWLDAVAFCNRLSRIAGLAPRLGVTGAPGAPGGARGRARGT